MYGEKDYSERAADRQAIVGVPAVDWLTLTTWNGDQRIFAESVLAGLWPSLTWESKKVGRYDGMGIEGLSIGEAVQDGHPHFQVQVTGWKADGALEALSLATGRVDLSLWTCTRLDVQITLPPIPERPSLGEIGWMTRAGLFGKWRGHRQPKIMVQSSTDGDTVYFGAPSSSRRARLYDKPILRGGKKEIDERFEVQLRSELAQAALKRITKPKAGLSRTAMWGVLNRELDKMPEGTVSLLAASWGGLAHPSAEAEAIPRKVATVDSARLRWIKTALKVARLVGLQEDSEAEKVREALAETLLQIVLKEALVFPAQYVLLDIALTANRDFAERAEGVYSLSDVLHQPVGRTWENVED